MRKSGMMGRGVSGGWRRRGIALGLWLFGVLSGCAGSSSNGVGPGCQSFCSSLCKSLAACNVAAPEGCVNHCLSGVGNADCSEVRAPDQLTCAELGMTYACADYCATLCTRGPSCGSFDAALCAEGCAWGPLVCNSAAVAARTCDQLKPELRLYEDTARIRHSGGEIVGSRSPKSFGLCEDGDDCELPLGCSLATNTCASCATDADCERGLGAYACTAEKQCSKVGCTKDDDCSLFCDVERHTCGDCRSDADCTLSLKACNLETSKCVACNSDAQCTDGVRDQCDLARHACRECLSNADCAGELYSPRCDPDLGFCTSCEVDTDCTKPGTPVCEHLTCVACRENADCTNAALPVCEKGLEKCVQCSKPEDCPAGKGCNAFGNTCNP